MILPERKLYGRHKGHKLSSRQEALFSTLLARLRIQTDERCHGDIRAFFDFPATAIHLEIGFGGGEHLAWQASRNKDIGYIGCEPFVNGVAKLLVMIDEMQIENVRIFNDDARFILDWLPESSIDKIYILFPDPWPKRRHRKRRFISPETLDKLSRVMKPGSRLHLATDIGDYMRSSLVAFLNHSEYEWLDNGPTDWNFISEPRPVTRYEQKALDAGRKPAYLTFERVARASH